MVHMGHSPRHASTIPLVLNPSSGAMKAVYHVVLDDWFSTVSSTVDDLPDFTSAEWSQIFGDSLFQYPDDDEDDPDYGVPPTAEFTARSDRVRHAADPPMPPVSHPREPVSHSREPLSHSRESVLHPREPVSHPREHLHHWREQVGANIDDDDQFRPPPVSRAPPSCKPPALSPRDDDSDDDDDDDLPPPLLSRSKTSTLRQRLSRPPPSQFLVSLLWVQYPEGEYAASAERLHGT